MKVTFNQMKSDLRELKYYYLMEKTFKNEKTKASVRVVGLVERYSKIMDNAPIKFQGYFNAKYKQGATRQQMAEAWNVSISFVKKIQDEFLKFLFENLEKEDK